MLKLNVVCVGKIKESFYREAVAEYLKRMSRFAKVSVVEIAEGKTLFEEGKSILRAAKGYVFALCVEGEKMSSRTLAGNIKTLTAKGEEITFIIGSSYGLDDTVKQVANCKLSFSDMTFPHQLMRVILLEQIYRAFMIISGSEYHK